MAADAVEVRVEGRLAVLLALTGGWVDAVGYVVLLHLFTAHMSGNTVALAVAVGGEDWSMALRRGFPIPTFVLGVMIGATLHEVLARRGVRPTFAVAFALEAILILLFLVFGSRALRDGVLEAEPAWRFYLYAALPALAMGVQNATLRRVSRWHVATTYVSGVLTGLAEEVIRLGFHLHDRRRGREESTADPPSAARAVLLLSIWLGYVGGGAIGAVLQYRWQLAGSVGPVLLLAVLAGYDLIRPFAEPGPAR